MNHAHPQSASAPSVVHRALRPQGARKKALAYAKERAQDRVWVVVTGVLVLVLAGAMFLLYTKLNV